MTAPLELPEPIDEPLTLSPLSLVVCQVRHDRNLAASDPKRALAVQSRVSSDYPTIAEAPNQLVTVVAGPGNPQLVAQGEQPKGWQFRSADERWSATVQPDWYALETSAYTTWPDFRDRLRSLTQAVAEEIGPAVEQRVGLRYVDEIRKPVVTDPRDWRGWISDELLGPINHPSFGSALKSVQQVLELQGPDSLGVILRHGALPVPGAARPQWLYLLDLDCFRQQGRAFSSESVSEVADQLHRLALQSFQATISAKLYEYLREGEVE